MNTKSIQIQTQEDMPKSIYGSFILNGCEFALSVDYIQEVVNDPQSYTEMPMSPNYLVGLFNLRGLIIPVIDLQKIFKLKGHYNSTDRKVAIMEYENMLIGILFDRTSEVFNGSIFDKNDFQDELTNSMPLIQGVYKLDDGARIIQIIDPNQIADLKNIPRSKDSSSYDRRKRKSKRHKCISFTVGGAACSLQMMSIQEILRTDNIKPISLALTHCVGSIEVRGHEIPIIDFANLLGYPDYDMTRDNHTVIVMKINSVFFGLLIDSVDSILSYFEEDVVTFPVLSVKKPELIKGCISDGQQIESILLDHVGILSNHEIEEMAKGYSRLFNKNAQEKKDDSGKSLGKNTYILFSIRKQYALQINEVNEVFDCPSEFIHPPNFPQHFRGMINLRGDLIPVIDPQILYHMESYEPSKESKLVIFKSEDKRYGIIVDSVDSIKSFTQNKRIKMPKLLFDNKERDLYKDVKEVVEINEDGTDHVLLILDPNSIVKNLH